MVGSGCFTSVSVFTVDYDAPTGSDQDTVRAGLGPLVTYQKKSRAMYARDDEREVRELIERMPVHGGSF